VPTFHIDNPASVEASVIRYRPVGGGTEARLEGWLPQDAVTVGLTAGASTPDSVVGGVIERLLAVRGYSAAHLPAPLAMGSATL
jgi:4-hydroxy-3-methylbut-2-enyl diphosphate reductase